MVSETLRSRAMLVSLSQRAWKGKAADREMAAKAERDADAEQGTMTLIKQLVPKPMIDRVQHALTIGRQEHYRLTTPGLFRGQHLLSTAMFETYMLTQQGCRDEFWKKVNEFLDIYPDAVKQSKATRLGSSFKAMDFPSAEQIKGYFDYNVVCGPVPDIHDWRLEGIDSHDVSELRTEVEDGIRAMYVEATRTIYDRARKVLESLISQAKEYSLDAPGARLRDATIDHIKEVSALVCDMNITNDPVLEKVGRTMLKEFADLNGHELRRSAELRDSTAKMAQSILAKMVAAKKHAA